MSKSLHIGAIALAAAFLSGSSVEPLTADRVSPSAQPSIPGSPVDVAAIQQIVTTFDQTWGSDPVTYAAQYGSVIDWVGPTGTILNDPEAITALYTFLFTNVFAGTTRISTNPQPDLPERDGCRPGHRNAGRWIRAGPGEERPDQA